MTRLYWLEETRRVYVFVPQWKALDPREVRCVGSISFADERGATFWPTQGVYELNSADLEAVLQALKDCATRKGYEKALATRNPSSIP